MYGGHSMTQPLRRVLVKRPTHSFAVQDAERWHYTDRPDLAIAQQEHDDLVALLIKAGAEVLFHEETSDNLSDSIFVHDPILQTDKGAVVLRMGKLLRRGEEAALEHTLTKLGVPIIGRLQGDATAEGGDLLWLDEKTLAAGRGYRTNDEGIRQLGEILRPQGVSVVAFQLPHFYGPEACLHLQSLISFVSEKKAVVYLPLMPVPLVEHLQRQQVTLIDVPQNEFEKTMATNVLALGGDKCLMLQDNPVTEAAIKKAGVEVLTYRGFEISLKAEGGATCLTRPLYRSNK